MQISNQEKCDFYDYYEYWTNDNKCNLLRWNHDIHQMTISLIELFKIGNITGFLEREWHLLYVSLTYFIRRYQIVTSFPAEYIPRLVLSSTQWAIAIKC